MQGEPAWWRAELSVQSYADFKDDVITLTAAAAHPFQARQNWWETGCISSPLASLQLLLPSEWLTHSSAHWPKPQHTPQVPPRKQLSAPGTAGSCPLGSYFLWSLYQHSVTDRQMTTLALIKAEPPKSWALSMGPTGTLFFHGSLSDRDGHF